MKKLNLLTLICALVMGLSLTSCLDSGDSGTSWEDARTVYVRSYLGQAFFVDAYGVRYYPSTESLNAFRQNNSDFDLNDYKMMNLRAKGSIQVFDWLKIENNMEFSNMNYHNPMNVGEGGSIWRNISDEGHPSAPIYNPDGTFTHSAAYTLGDFIYGKNGIDTNNRVLRNTTSFTASFWDNKIHVRGDFTFRNTDEGQTQRRVAVPYSTQEGVISYLSTQYNDLQEYKKETNYLATNIYADYEETFNEAHYFKGMIGYNYEQSTYDALKVLRNGLLLEDSENINMALGDAITTSGEYNRWRVAGAFFRLNYAFKDRYLVEVNGRYDGSSKFPVDQQ